MYKISLTFIVVLIFAQNVFGQNSTILGKVIFESNLTFLDSVKVDLLNSQEVIIKTVYSDSQGYYIFENLKSGNYCLQTKPKADQAYKIIDILLKKNDTIEIDFLIKEPCQNQHQTNICPYCNSSKKVLRISPGTIVSYNFGNNKSAIRRYNRKNRFETYKNEEEEVVISMHIESEKEKFWDFCHHWFCKKCKRVF